MCVLYQLILNLVHELIWALGETIIKKSEVPNLIFDTINYDYINDFEEVILLLVNQHFYALHFHNGCYRYTKV